MEEASGLDDLTGDVDAKAESIGRSRWRADARQGYADGMAYLIHTHKELHSSV